MRVLVAIAAVVSLSGCGGEAVSTRDLDVEESSGASAVDECTARGVAYFKEIGSYPVLHSEPNAGRAAEDVARERCERTTTAF